MIVDEIANILCNNYSYSLEETYNKWRQLAKLKGLLKDSVPSDLKNKYNALNTKEEVLEPSIIKKLLGSSSSGLNYFFERGIFQEHSIHSQQKACIFCQLSDNWLEDSDDKLILYKTAVPQYQNREVSLSVLVCDSCLLKIQTFRDLSEYACIDNCKDCRNDYLVEPIEFERRIEEEGRGKHTCDDCLTIEGFQGYNYIQSNTCSSCQTDSTYRMSLRPEEPSAIICDSCKVEVDYDQLGDEAESKKSFSSIEKGRRNIKDNLANGYKGTDNQNDVHEKYRDRMGPFVYQLISMGKETLGNEYMEPENIWASIYEIEPDPYKGRLMSFDLVEISPNELEKNGVGRKMKDKYHKVIQREWITWQLIWFDLESIANKKTVIHNEYFEMNPEGFDLLYTAADQLALYVIDALKQSLIEPGIHEGRLQSYIISH